MTSLFQETLEKFIFETENKYYYIDDIKSNDKELNETRHIIKIKTKSKPKNRKVFK